VPGRVLTGRTEGMRMWIPATVFLVGAGCGTASPPGEGPESALRLGAAPLAQGDGGVIEATAAPPPPVALAAAPRIDLDANGPRWHLTDRGLVLPLAGEGLRKYDLAYRSPWGAATTVDGRPARSAGGKAALAFPWLDGDGAAELVLRGHGPGKVS